MNKNCLSYWFPKLLAAGAPVPRTEIVRTDCDLLLLTEGKTPDGWSGFLADLNVAANKVAEGGTRVFLRTGQGSGKHDWKRTCDLDFRTGSLPDHILALVEWSHLVSIFGLAHDVWVVREMLPVEPVATLPRYGDMPLVTEVRVFVRGGGIVCLHDYWPDGAIADGMECSHGMPHVGFGEDAEERCSRCAVIAADLFEKMSPSLDDAGPVHDLAIQVARAFEDDGAWSVDLLKTTRGWFVTDMAVASQSYHWPKCEFAEALR